MVRRIAGVVAASVLLTTTTPADVRAQWSTFGASNLCGGSLSAFNVCFNFAASFGTRNGQSVLVLTVTNLGAQAGPPVAYDAVFRGFGFGSTSAFSLTGLQGFVTSVDNAPLQAWDYSRNLTFLSDQFSAPFAGVAAAPPPSQTGLQPGESTTFYFTFRGTQSFEGATFAMHGIAGPEGCSTKVLVTNPGGTATVSSLVGGVGAAGDCLPTTVVPEPATIALLGSGLVGMGGAALRRRRQQATT